MPSPHHASVALQVVDNPVLNPSHVQFHICPVQSYVKSITVPGVHNPAVPEVILSHELSKSYCIVPDNTPHTPSIGESLTTTEISHHVVNSALPEFCIVRTAV